MLFQLQASYNLSVCPWWVPTPQSLPAAARSGYAVELETRAMGLSFEEGTSENDTYGL